MTVMNDITDTHHRKFIPNAEQNAQRTRAIKAASRHSTIVRILKKLIVLGALLAIAGFGLYLYYDPFAKPAINVTVNKTELDGTHITMDAPHLSGYHADGRAYDLQARSGIQDLTKPGLIDLIDVDSHFDTQEQGKAHVRAPSGRYDSARDFMALFGDVTITSDNGYNIKMHNADIDFKAGNMTTNDPVNVLMNDGHIRSDRMTMINNGELITFDGQVRSLFTLNDSSDDIQKDKTK
jgi:lipopolysaccharide export system protein LptC